MPKLRKLSKGLRPRPRKPVDELAGLRGAERSRVRIALGGMIRRHAMSPAASYVSRIMQGGLELQSGSLNA